MYNCTKTLSGYANLSPATQLALKVQEAMSHMPEGGSVLFITSIAAFFPDDRSSLIMAMYGVSKTALLGVVKALSFELGLSGVRVNGLAAGVIPTGFSSILTGEKNRHLVVCDCTCQHVFQS